MAVQSSGRLVNFGGRAGLGAFGVLAIGGRQAVGFGGEESVLGGIRDTGREG
jgi:hypothetical protein